MYSVCMYMLGCFHHYWTIYLFLELIVEKYTDVHHTIGRDSLKVLDLFIKKKTDVCLSVLSLSLSLSLVGLHKPFPSNSLQLMAQQELNGLQ